MYSSVKGLSFLVILIMLTIIFMVFSFYHATKNKKKSAWTPVLLYAMCIIADWYYAYSTQQLYATLASAWFVIFPLFSYFYLFFSAIAASGIYHLKKWGFGLGYITILAGLISYANTTLVVYTQFPLMPEFFTLISILNFIVLLYLAVYGMMNKLGNDNNNE